MLYKEIIRKILKFVSFEYFQNRWKYAYRAISGFIQWVCLFGFAIFSSFRNLYFFKKSFTQLDGDYMIPVGLDKILSRFAGIPAVL